MAESLASLLIRGPWKQAEPQDRVPHDADVKIALRGVNVYYGEHRAICDLYLDLYRDCANVLLGASGSGKSTVLRCLNRFTETVPYARVEGVVAIDGRNVMMRSQRVNRLRRRFGMVVQKPNPFPKSIYENVAYGPRIHRLAENKAELDRLVKRSLEQAGLWAEVCGELNTRATELSVGQQQRLCIARALAYAPEVFLFDEPCAGLDPIASSQVEDLILALRQQHTVVVATHSLDRATKLSQYAAFLHEGRLLESGPTETLLAAPQSAEMRAFVEAQSNRPLQRRR